MTVRQQAPLPAATGQLSEGRRLTMAGTMRGNPVSVRIGGRNKPP